MSDEKARIEELRAELARIQTLAELERKLLSVAPRFHDALQRSTMIGRRDDLGLQVISIDMPYLGLTAFGPTKTLVALHPDRDPTIRRQTLAHECAHGLLREVDRARLRLNREREDKLCSHFARRALMPADYVEEFLREHGFPADVPALQHFCRHFRVGFRMAIKTLDEHANRCPTVLIAATLRSHQKRPWEVGFRVDASASDRRLYAPPDRRLVSMGLSSLARWARWAEPGDRLAGEDERVVLRSRTGTAQSWYGPAKWSAKVICSRRTRSSRDNKALLVALDRSDLKPLAWDPSRVPAPVRLSEGQLHPAQTRLVAS